MILTSIENFIIDFLENRYYQIALNVKRQISKINRICNDIIVVTRKKMY